LNHVVLGHVDDVVALEESVIDHPADDIIYVPKDCVRGAGQWFRLPPSLGAAARRRP